MFKRNSNLSVPSTPLPAPPANNVAVQSSSSSSGEGTPPASLIPFDESYQNENEKAGLLLKRVALWEKLVEAVLPWVKRACS